LMAEYAANPCKWGDEIAFMKSPERLKWEQRFSARWNRMAPDQRQRQYGTLSLKDTTDKEWQRFKDSVHFRFGRGELRSGRIRFTSSKIFSLLQSESNKKAIVEGAMHGKGLNPISLSKWLKDHLVDAPIGGRVLRSARGRENSAQFWVTRVC